MVTLDHDRITTPDSAESSFWASTESLLVALNEASRALAGSTDVSDEVAAVVRRLVDVIGPLPAEEFAGADPYLVESLLAGVVGCAGALWAESPTERRRELRVPLERTRQALRDLLAERDVSAERPAKEIARWLNEVSGVPQPRLAELVGVAPRTFQRWVSASGTGPSGDDETRLRTLARTVDQLRWSMTPAGVLKWLGRPHPSIGERPPSELLDDPIAYRDLPRLAATTRATIAS